MSGADSVMWPIQFIDYDKTFMMYIGTYDGVGYFTTDRLYDEEYFNKTHLTSGSKTDEISPEAAPAR
jgi:hypothetical protein